MEDTQQFAHDGVTFTFRGKATRGDQYEMHAAMADNVEMADGKIIRARPSKLYPWVIDRFVTGWSLQEPWSLKALMDQPASPGEDLVLVLGSYILNHTGLVVTPQQESLKNA